jgi:hypothetical protein
MRSVYIGPRAISPAAASGRLALKSATPDPAAATVRAEHGRTIAVTKEGEGNPE